MTDKKISDLPAASVFNDADEVAIVQSGDTKKATGALIKAGVAPAAATESAAGILEIANTTEAQSRTEDARAMTSKKVQDWADGGIILNGATGGDQGDGSINVDTLFINGVQVSGSGGLILLDSVEVSGAVATVEFTSSIDAVYDAYYVTLTNVSPSTDGANLQVEYSTDGGTSYAAPSNIVRKEMTGTTEVYSASIAEKISIAVDSTTGEGVNGWGYLFGMGSGTVDKTMQYHLSNYYSSGGDLVVVDSDQIQRTVTPLNAIEFAFSSGNIASGTIALYGIRKS